MSIIDTRPKACAGFPAEHLNSELDVRVYGDLAPLQEKIFEKWPQGKRIFPEGRVEYNPEVLLVDAWKKLAKLDEGIQPVSVALPFGEGDEEVSLIANIEWYLECSDKDLATFQSYLRELTKNPETAQSIEPTFSDLVKQRRHCIKLSVSEMATALLAADVCVKSDSSLYDKKN